MRNFREEMRRGMGRGMIAAMLMTMFPMLLAVLSYLPDVYTEKYYASSLIVNAIYKSGLTPIAFIAAAFAYSTSYISDIECGALRYHLTRCGRMRFAADRFIANAICGALGVAVGEAAFYLILRTLYPVQDIAYRVVTEYNAMEMLSYTRPELYYFIMILVQIPICMVMASVALVVSTFVRNAYITLASPIIFVGLITALPERLGGDMIYNLIYASTDIALWAEGYTLFFRHLAFCAIMLAITFVVFCFSVYRYKGE